MSDIPSNPVADNAKVETNPMYVDPAKPATAAEAALKPEPVVGAESTAVDPFQDASAEFAKKFAALSRKERESRELQKSFEEREAALAAREAEIKEMQEKYSQNQDIVKKMKYDPLNTVKELADYSFEDLTKFELEGGKLPPEVQIELLKKELEKKFEAQISDVKTQYEQAEQAKAEQQQAAAEQTFKNEITETVTTAVDAEGTAKYELIAANEASDLVYDVIEQHHSETGKILEIEEAADQVERYLEEQVEKLTKLKKFSKFIKPQDTSEAKPAPGQSSPTLSNDLAAQSTPTKTRLSNDQSLSEAAKLLRWND